MNDSDSAQRRAMAEAAHEANRRNGVAMGADVESMLIKWVQQSVLGMETARAVIEAIYREDFPWSPQVAYRRYARALETQPDALSDNDKRRAIISYILNRQGRASGDARG